MSKLFKGKKVLIMGLGLHGGGVGVVKFFYKEGAEVLVTDLKTEQQLEESIIKLKNLDIKYSLGGHKEADFTSSDLIIKNPDVPNTSPYLEIARKNNISIETDVSLFFKLSKAFIVGVTGTKGKSTTASLIFHILKAKYKRIFLAGNIGVSPLEVLSKAKKGDVVILELSSFELENLGKSPNIAVVTNIMPDHLNRYASMHDYIKSKKIIFKYQNKKDYLVLNYDDEVVKSFAKEAKSKVVFFSLIENKPVIKSIGFKLTGEHNIYNLLAAVSVAKILKLSPVVIERAVKSFNGISSRQEFIKEVNGVKYYNDTTATMPDAVIAAIRSLNKKHPGSNLVLICGGQDKGLNYANLVKEIGREVSSVVLLPGTASDKIKEEIVVEKIKTPIILVQTMSEAVEKAKSQAKPKDIILLSPAAASFNLFKNEFDRGEQFVKIVKLLK